MFRQFVYQPQAIDRAFQRVVKDVEFDKTGERILHTPTPSGQPLDSAVVSVQRRRLESSL
jgi:hypothetical protein